MTNWLTSVVVGAIRQRNGFYRELWGSGRTPEGHREARSPETAGGLQFPPSSSERPFPLCRTRKGPDAREPHEAPNSANGKRPPWVDPGEVPPCPRRGPALNQTFP